MTNNGTSEKQQALLKKVRDIVTDIKTLRKEGVEIQKDVSAAIDEAKVAAKRQEIEDKF